VITFHCRHRHPLRSAAPQVPHQRSELEDWGGSN
jgi:hypothetical protein